MKKKKLFIITILSIFITFNINNSVKAFSASVKCSSSSNTVSVGQSFNIIISGYSDSTTDWKSAGPINSSSNVRLTSGDTGSSIWFDDKNSFSKTYSFTALSTGTATFSQTMIATNPDDFSSPSFTSNTCTINIVEATASNSSSSKSSKSSSKKTTTDSNKNSDNNLKSLEVEDVTLDSEFDKDKLEYKAEVENNINKIYISAKANDSKAKVSGTGSKDLEEGINTFEIVVTAENGSTRTYTITIIRKEENPVTVKVNGKEYNVIKKEGVLEPLEGFEKIDLVIKDQNVLAYKHNKTGFIIVGLTDKEGNSAWYRYENKKFEKYNEFKSNDLKLYILNKAKYVPYKYKKCTFDIDGNKINGYVLDNNSDFRLLYAINLSTGEKNYYLYDLKEKTFQRFYNQQVLIYLNLIKKVKLAFIVIAAIIFSLFIYLLIQKILYKRLKKRITNDVKKDREEIEEKVVDEIKEEQISHTRDFKDLKVENDTYSLKNTKVLKPVKEEEIPEEKTKEQLKEEKKKRKEELKRQKKEANDFLNE